MKKQRKLKRDIKSEINVIPFLDILLVLLIIFMMMPSKLMIQQKNLEVHLPSHHTTKNINNENKFLIIVEILGMGVYNFTVDNVKMLHLSLNELISEINSAKVINPNLTCLIAASKEEKYNEIIQILNMLNNIGINSIGMMTNSVQIQNK